MKKQANRTRRSRGKGAALFVAALLAAAAIPPACRKTPQQRYEERVRETAPPGLHAVHSERLAAVMRELQRLSAERLPQELDLDFERRRRREEVIEVAGAMGEAAVYIQEVLKEVELTAEREEQFRQLAIRLQEECTELARRAPELSVSQINERLQGIRSTCNSCHDRFRVLPALPRS